MAGILSVIMWLCPWSRRNFCLMLVIRSIWRTQRRAWSTHITKTSIGHFRGWHHSRWIRSVLPGLYLCCSLLSGSCSGWFHHQNNTRVAGSSCRWVSVLEHSGKTVCWLNMWKCCLPTDVCIENRWWRSQFCWKRPHTRWGNDGFYLLSVCWASIALLCLFLWRKTHTVPDWTRTRNKEWESVCAGMTIPRTEGGTTDTSDTTGDVTPLELLISVSRNISMFWKRWNRQSTSDQHQSVYSYAHLFDSQIFSDFILSHIYLYIFQIFSYIFRSKSCFDFPTFNQFSYCDVGLQHHGTGL